MKEPHHQPASRPDAPLHVALNGWFWQQETTGSGQYLRRLVAHLLALPGQERYSLVVPAQMHLTAADLPPGAGERLQVQPATTPFDGHSAALAKIWFEQMAFPASCQRIGAQVAHVPYWATPWRSPVPCLTTIHDLIPLLLPAYRGSALVRLYTRLVSATARRSTLVLTDSEASAQDLRTHLGLPAERIRMIHLGVDTAYQPVQDAGRLSAWRAQHGLEEGYILYLGGFDVRKNVAGVIAAYVSLARRRSDVPPLVIAGRLPKEDSAFTPDPRRLIVAAGLSEKVHFLGWVPEEDKPALYTLAGCFVFPTFYEGFGLPVLEAMACGTPVITSRNSSLEEIAGDGGLLIDPSAPAELADALETLLFDPPARRRYAQQALAQASRFRWDKAAQQTRLAYRQSTSIDPSASD